VANFWSPGYILPLKDQRWPILALIGGWGKKGRWLGLLAKSLEAASVQQLSSG
jgi:hypothetical protein